MPRVRRPVSSTETTEDRLGENDEAGIGQDPPPRTRTPRKRAAVKATGNRGKIATRSTSGRIMSKAQMIDKVSAEVYMWLSLAANGWELSEEIQGVAEPCARVMFETVRVPTPDGVVEVERLSGIAARITAVIARNDSLLSTVAKGGIITDIAVLATLLWPVGRMIATNHVLGSHSPRAETSNDDFERQYPIPAFAN